MVKDLNSDSQKLFKDYLKKKVPSINIDELPMNDFEKSYLRGVLPKVIEKPKFAESYFDSVLLWGKIQNVSLMDIVESFGGSEEDYHSYIKNLNTKSDSVDTNIEQESEAYDSFESESYDESES